MEKRAWIILLLSLCVGAFAQPMPPPPKVRTSAVVPVKGITNTYAFGVSCFDPSGLESLMCPVLHWTNFQYGTNKLKPSVTTLWDDPNTPSAVGYYFYWGPDEKHMTNQDITAYQTYTLSLVPPVKPLVIRYDYANGFMQYSNNGWHDTNSSTIFITNPASAGPGIWFFRGRSTNKVAGKVKVTKL